MNGETKRGGEEESDRERERAREVGDPREGERACSTRVSLIAFISNRGVQPL